MSKRETLIALIPLIVSVALLLMNPLNGILFKIDQNGKLQEGPFYLLYVFINDLYYLVGAYKAYVYSCRAKIINKRNPIRF